MTNVIRHSQDTLHVWGERPPRIAETAVGTEIADGLTSMNNFRPKTNQYPYFLSASSAISTGSQIETPLP